MRELLRRREFPPFALSFLIIIVLAVHYWSLLPLGQVKGVDEYRTLDRVHSFVIRDDFFVVYSENRPTFKKPPLQYWMSAFLIRQGADLEFALRSPSFLFGILTLISVGALAYLLYPANPWVAPGAIALLAGSLSFWKANISALLDSGATLFATAAMIGCLLAFSRPKWWYLVALAIGLAAWQKAPIPLVLVAIMVIFVIASRKFHSIDCSVAFLNRHFGIAVALTVIALMIWPALQWLRFGSESFQEAYVDEMMGRFSVVGERIGRHRWVTNFFDREWALRIPAALALLALPWVVRRFELFALTLLMIAFAVAIKFATGTTNPRYALIFLPLMTAALAVVIVKIVPGRFLPVGITVGLALSLGGPIRSAEALGLLGPDLAHPIPMLQNISKMLRKEETLLVCFPSPKKNGFRLATVSYFASNGRPFYTVDSPEAFAKLEGEGTRLPYRGLCHTDSFETIKPFLPSYHVIEESDGYLHWTAP